VHLLRDRQEPSPHPPGASATPEQPVAVTVLVMTGDQRFDLHTHSVCSDGHDEPESLVAMAAEAGLAGLALTDHDTGEGIARALEAGAERGIEIVPGTEFSAELDGRSVHVLGYWVDFTHGALARELARLRDERDERARAIVARFNALGIDVRYERVAELAGGAPIGRPHIAAAVVETGACRDERQVFDDYLSDDGPAYVPKHAVHPVRAVELLRAAGGQVVLAHPGLFGSRDGSDSVPIGLVADMRDAGMRGIEADHPDHAAAEQEHWRAVAGRLGLAITGGSDHHGGERASHIGAAVTGRATVEHLRSGD
jgi:predicted metal-dependent phosphoesterase TrpH